MSAQVLGELAPLTGEVRPSASVHDATLEPRDETVAELQSFTVQSRQVGPLDMAECVAAISHCTRRVIETRNPDWAIACAAFALRLREEHLV